MEQAEQGKVLPFTIQSGDDTKWVYFQNWSIALLRDGIYTTLNLSEREWKNNQLPSSLPPVSIAYYRKKNAERQPFHQRVSFYCSGRQS